MGKAVAFFKEQTPQYRWWDPSNPRPRARSGWPVIWRPAADLGSRNQLPSANSPHLQTCSGGLGTGSPGTGGDEIFVLLNGRFRAVIIVPFPACQFSLLDPCAQCYPHVRIKLPQSYV